jgi:cytochrome b6-f complex iron-sulfur subunit
MSTSSGWQRLLLLYPRAWRVRFGEEFLALLAERPPGLRDLADIAASAIDARMHPRAWQPDKQLALVASEPTHPKGLSGTSAATRRESASQRRFSRRTFLRNAVLGGAIVSAAAASGGAVYFAWPNTTSAFETEIIVPRSEVPAAGDPPRKFVAGKFYLSADLDGVLALYWKCPHLGCTVPWEPNEDRFHCPCHQSVYDRHGVRVSGPAPRPMDLMAIRFDAAGNAIVHTGQISKRENYAPEQAVRAPA